MRRWRPSAVVAAVSVLLAVLGEVDAIPQAVFVALAIGLLVATLPVVVMLEVTREVESVLNRTIQSLTESFDWTVLAAKASARVEMEANELFGALAKDEIARSKELLELASRGEAIYSHGPDRPVVIGRSGGGRVLTRLNRSKQHRLVAASVGVRRSR